MQKRTTNYFFKKYGDVYYRMPEAAESLNDSTLTLRAKKFDRMFYSSSDIYIANEEGISMLFVSQDGENFEQFIMHRIVRIDPNVYFNIVPISSKSTINLRYNEETFRQKMIAEPITFKPIVPHLQIEEILSASFHVRKANYHGKGHVDDFFELIYIDHGRIHLLVDNKECVLSDYDTLVVYPGQNHVLYTTEQDSCSYLVIDFQMSEYFSQSLKDQVFRTDKRIYNILSRFMTSLEKNTELDDDLAIIYLKEALLLLHQNRSEDQLDDPMHENFENTLLNEILVYIHNNLYSPLAVEDLCERFTISRSTIQNLFRSHIHTTPKQYISDLKLNEAKKMILEHKYTISEISTKLGFTSIHYFSRKFKEHFQMSPTEFAKSSYTKKVRHDPS